MNVSLKKLLSLALALAMVASMIVPVNFSTAKAETSVIPEAAQAAIAKGKLVQEKSAELHQAGTFSGTGEVQAICPVCYASGDTSVKTWKPITNSWTPATGLGGDHYYLAEVIDVAYSNQNNGFITGAGCLNLNGKNVTIDGSRFVQVGGGATINIVDTAGGAIVSGSCDNNVVTTNYGTTLRAFEKGAVLNLFGGTYVRGADTETTNDNAVAVVGIRGGTVNMYEGATIQNGTSSGGNGGNVYLGGASANEPVMNMYGGTIQGGNAGSGGNVFVNNGNTFNLYAGTITNGEAKYGGNIYIQRSSDTSYGTFKMYGGSITEGVSTYTGKDTGGGNIANKGALEIYGGEILNGTAAKASGGNIACYNSATIKPVVTISGGFIAGGTAYSVDYGHNIFLGGYTSSSKYYCTTSLTMNGGTVVGYLAAFNATTSAFGSTAKYTPAFSGTARLVPYGVDSQGNAYSATTTLTKVTFSSASITTGGILFGGALDKAYGYCPDCKKASVAWTVVTTETEMTAGGHYIFLGSPLDYTIATPSGTSALLKSKGKACIDLNGADIKVHKGRFLTVDAAGTVNVRDSAGGATVSGSFDYYTGNGRVIQTTDGYESILNLYGGTYKGFVYEGDAVNGTKNATALIRVRNKATVNLFEGATVDGSSIEQKVAAVFVGNAANTSSTFNLEGGTVIGTKNAGGDGDAVRLGNSANSATLNVNSGKIIGAGGVAINVRSGSTLNVAGGSITNENGAGVNCYQTNTISVSGGEVSTLNVTEGSTLTLSGKPVIGMLYTNGVLANVDGLSSEADITVGMEAGTVLTTATTNDLDGVFKHTDSELVIKKNADGQYYVDKNFDEPVAGVFDPEACGGWAYCPICGGAAVEWTAINPEDAQVVMDGGHYYLTDDYTATKTFTNYSLAGHGCFNLNGKTVTGGTASKALVATTGALNVMDTSADKTGKVIGAYNYANQGGAAEADGGILNLYGGTYTTTNETVGSVVAIRGINGGEINIYDGVVIDASTAAKTAAYGPAVSINANSGKAGVVNMHGGKIIGTTNAGTGGAIYAANNRCTFTMYGGEIVCGQGTNGNAISNVKANGSPKVNLFGGKITAKEGATGPSIYLDGDAVTITFGDAERSPVIEGGVQIVSASKVTLANQTQIDSLELGGELADITDLKAGAKIGIVATYDVPFTTAYEGDVDMATVFTTTLENAVLKQNDEGQFYYKEKVLPKPGEFKPWECEGEAYCPICEDIKIWTAIDSNTEIKDKATVITMTEDHDHYYFAENLNVNYSYVLGGFINGSGCLNLNGKTITLNGGKLVDLGAGYTMNIIDTKGGAVVTGSCDYYGNDGRVLRVNTTGATLNLYGGTFMGMNDTYSAYGKDEKDNGSATVAVRGGVLNMYDGATIVGVDGTEGNTSNNGGAVYINADKNNKIAGTFNMYGGTIRDGKASNYGGNVYAAVADATYFGTFNMHGGEILNGEATRGGNVFINSTMTVGAAMTMDGGFIAGGKVPNSGAYGANLCLHTASSTADGTTTYANNCSFSMTGGTIVGGAVVGYGLSGNKTYTISGTAKVIPTATHNGVTYDGGSIGLVRISFDSADAQKGFEVWTGQAKATTYTWCDHCEKIVKINNLKNSSEPVSAAEGHYRFLEDVSYTFTENGNKNYFTTKGTTYIDLNGCDVTVDGGRFIEVSVGAQVTVIDSVGGAIVTGSNDYYSGGGVTIHVNHKDAVLNLKGGTYRGMNDTSTAVSGENGKNGECKDTPVVRMRAGGTINLYTGATIDGTTLTDRSNATVYLGYSNTLSTFNMEGGTVLGGKNSESDGGAFRVGDGTGTAVLNVNSGTIVGGVATSGAAIQVRTGNTLNVNGGTIKHQDGGEGTLIGSYTDKGVGTTMNFNGGNVQGLVVMSADSSLKASGAPQIESLETRENLIDVTGVTADARIGIVVDYNVPFTTAYNGTVDMTKVFVFKDAVLLTQNDEKQFMIIVPTVVIDGKAYGTVEDALADYDIESGKAVIFMQSEVTISEDILLDVAASAENLVISGTGTVYGFDTTNDDYEGYIKITVSGEVEVAPEATANGNRYMSLKEGSQYGFHRFVTKLTHVTLRTSAAGLYFKASYECDAVVRDRVLAHGVVLSVADMPGQNFLADKGNLYTAIEGQFKGVYDAATHSVKTTSGSVFGILKDTRDAAVNTQYLTVDIYANSYFLVDRDGNGDTYFYMADTQNGGKKRGDEGFNGVVKNLLEVVTAMNNADFFAKLSAAQKTNLVGFASDWSAYLDDAGKAKWAAATSNMKN